MTLAVDRLLVVGVGLIGGSFAVALRDAGLVGEIIGLGRTRANLDAARARGLIDRVITDPRDAAHVDAVFLATPVGACGAAATALRPHVRPGTLLTDGASVKASVVQAMESAWSGVGPVIGGHPIAGSDAYGAEAARPDLFRGRRCILTPTASTNGDALARVRGWWEAVGARVETMSPDEHDRVLAAVSHLPHLVAYALMTATMGTSSATAGALDYAGSGFLDTTRIAASRAELWRDIFLANGTALGGAAQSFRAAFDAIVEALARGDASALDAVLGAAADARRSLGGDR